MLHILSVFRTGTSPRPWVRVCCPCPAASWPGWTQRQLGMVALAFPPQQGSMEGHTQVWEESSPPRTSAAVSAPLPRRWLAWGTQLFGYLSIPDVALCPLLSLPFSRGSLFSVWSHPLFILLAAQLHLFAFLRISEPALLCIRVFCMFTVSCYIPYK